MFALKSYLGSVVLGRFNPYVIEHTLTFYLAMCSQSRGGRT
jgi:hypothetical protein